MVTHFELESNRNSAELVAEQSARDIVSKFSKLPIGSKLVRCPYWMNLNPAYEGSDLYQYVPRGGKHTPEEIINATTSLLEKLGVNPDSLSEAQIRELMARSGLGVDCSGLTYQICGSIYEGLGGRGFAEKILGRGDGEFGITKTGARDLASPKNALRIEDVSQLKPGDMIRCRRGRHVISVIGSNPQEVICVHSTEFVKEGGVSQFSIKIIDPKRSIFEQEWSETNSGSKTYNESLLEEGIADEDGIWRLKILHEIYSATSHDKNE